MKRYRVDPQARADLVGIYAYIATDSVASAERQLDTLQDKFRLLAGHPLLGDLCPQFAPELRRFYVGNYLIFYFPIEQGIAIARVLHGSRDIDSLLRPS